MLVRTVCGGARHTFTLDGNNDMRAIAGLLSILPLVGLVAAALSEPLIWPRGGDFFDVLMLGLGLLGIATMIGHIWYANRSAAVPVDKRALWTTVLLFGNVFALPFFWFWYIRRPAQ